jgi:hypothetical protein
MAKIEEEIVTVSDNNGQKVEENTVVVKEAFGNEMMTQIQPIPIPGEGDTKLQQQTNDSRSWLQTQEAKDFLPFLMTEFKRIAPGSNSSRGKSETERALGQMKRLNSYISKALQSDYDGGIDVGQVDKVRQSIEAAVDRLEQVLEAISDLGRQKKRLRRRKASDDSLCSECELPLWEGESGKICLSCDKQDGIVREAATPRFNGLQYQISGFERAIIGTLINGKVSGGRDIEELYGRLKKKYGITDREHLAIIQAMSDMGYPVFLDRARIGEEEYQEDDKNYGEWQRQYFS